MVWEGYYLCYFVDDSSCYSVSVHAGLAYGLLNNCQVMTYDENAVRVTIDSLDEVRVYVKQNESDEIRRRKYVREALRGLDVHLTRNSSDAQGKMVSFPQDSVEVHCPEFHG